MLGKLKGIINDMTWYLRSGITPSTKNVSNLEELKNMNHMASKKFAMTMVAVAIIAFMYFASVLFLFLLPGDPFVSALVNMYKDMIVAVASIVATLVGIQGLVDWRHNSDSKVSLSSEYIKEEVDQKIVEQYAEKYKDDPSYAPLDWINERNF
jgi:hypothetical protein